MRSSRKRSLAVIAGPGHTQRTSARWSESVDSAGDDVIIPVLDADLQDALDDLERRLDVVLDGAAGPHALVLDMSGVEQVSSTTIAVLLWARRRCSPRGIEVLLRYPSRHCRSTLERMGLLGVLVVEPASADGQRIPFPFARRS